MKYTNGKCKRCERTTLHLNIETNLCRKCLNKEYGENKNDKIII